jgi:hypothetical protein
MAAFGLARGVTKLRKQRAEVIKRKDAMMSADGNGVSSLPLDLFLGSWV